jgi:hypothetical protein
MAFLWNILDPEDVIKILAIANNMFACIIDSSLREKEKRILQIPAPDIQMKSFMKLDIPTIFLKMVTLTLLMSFCYKMMSQS